MPLRTRARDALTAVRRCVRGFVRAVTARTGERRNVETPRRARMATAPARRTTMPAAAGAGPVAAVHARPVAAGPRTGASSAPAPVSWQAPLFPMPATGQLAIWPDPRDVGPGLVHRAHPAAAVEEAPRAASATPDRGVTRRPTLPRTGRGTGNLILVPPVSHSTHNTYTI